MCAKDRNQMLNRSQTHNLHFLRDLAERSSTPVIIRDETGKSLYYNTMFSEVFERSVVIDNILSHLPENIAQSIVQKEIGVFSYGRGVILCDIQLFSFQCKIFLERYSLAGRYFLKWTFIDVVCTSLDNMPSDSEFGLNFLEHLDYLYRVNQKKWVVLNALSFGLTYPLISKLANISVKTSRNYSYEILKNLNVPSVEDLILNNITYDCYKPIAINLRHLVIDWRNLSSEDKSGKLCK